MSSKRDVSPLTDLDSPSYKRDWRNSSSRRNKVRSRSPTRRRNDSASRAENSSSSGRRNSRSSARNRASRNDNVDNDRGSRSSAMDKTDRNNDDGRKRSNGERSGSHTRSSSRYAASSSHGERSSNHVGGLGLRTQIDKLTRALALSEEKSVLKQLTIKQKDDLIVKNRKLNNDLADLQKKNEDLYDRVDDLEQKCSNADEINDDLKFQLRTIKRRLGSKDYQYLMTSNLAAISSAMNEETKILYDDVLDKGISDKETIRLATGLILNVCPEAKFTFIKTLIALDTPAFRASMFVAISKLYEADRLKSTFVKEVLDSNAEKEAPSTPKNDIIQGIAPASIPDPGSVNKMVNKYFTQKNANCKVVRVKDVNLLAFTRDSSMVTTHKPQTDANGKDIKKRCVGCSTVFTAGNQKLLLWSSSARKIMDV